MDTYETLHVTTDRSIATLTLARPDRLNAMDATMLEELAAAAHALDSRFDVSCVIVRGEGRAFSAGADLSLFSSLYDGADARRQADLGRAMADAIERLRPVTIAAIHGWCVGGALVLAAACDLRVAAADTRFSIPEVDLGIPLAWGGIPRLVREIGPALTKELVLTCREFDAEEARAAGFLNRVVTGEDVEVAALRLARQISNKPRAAVEPTIRHVNAVTAQMVGLAHGWADADGLITAMHDDEAAAARAAYLADRGG